MQQTAWRTWVSAGIGTFGATEELAERHADTEYASVPHTKRACSQDVEEPVTAQQDHQPGILA